MYRGSDKILRLPNGTDEQKEQAQTADASKSDKEIRQKVWSPNYVLRCNDRQQELHDLYNARQGYLSNGLRTADQPLHHE